MLRPGRHVKLALWHCPAGGSVASLSKTYMFCYNIFFFYCGIFYTLSGRLSSLPSYYIPRDGPQSSYQEYISMLPPTEHPEVFGQHFNADIACQIAEARMLFDTLLSMQPQVSGPAAAGAGPSREDKVSKKAVAEQQTE